MGIFLFRTGSDGDSSTPPTDPHFYTLGGLHASPFQCHLPNWDILMPNWNIQVSIADYNPADWRGQCPNNDHGDFVITLNHSIIDRFQAPDCSGGDHLVQIQVPFDTPAFNTIVPLGTDCSSGSDLRDQQPECHFLTWPKQ
jgi:hypothetical protein